MDKILKQFFLAFVIIFLLDQFIKYLSLNGLRYGGEYLSLVLVFNDGVAFSMLSFLKQYLKYLHLFFILVLSFYLFYQKELLKENAIAFGIIIGAGSSNLFDRFVHGGVVDMFYWHKWFEFAVFNFADVAINFAVALIFLNEFILRKRRKNDRF